jgi:small-conductance mechanosensitive channel
MSQSMRRGKVDLRKIAFAVIILFGLVSCSRIYGFDEHVVSVLDVAFEIVITVIVAVVVWFVYRWLLAHTVEWFDETVDDGTKSDVYPLFSTVGGIVIFFVTMTMILIDLGIQATAAALTAGIMGLAISFGAQSTLSQFFSGLTLLVTHPFKVGDVLSVNGKKLVVKKIGLMNTTFSEWDYADEYNIPNSQVAGSTIVNLTSHREVYTSIFYLSLGYGCDIKLARKIIDDTVGAHPHVLKDENGRAANVEVDDLGPALISVKVTYKVDDYDSSGGVSTSLREQVVKNLMDGGIPMSSRTFNNVYFKKDPGDV